MRKLYLLSGPAASGKSTFIRENCLEPYTISFDTLRQLLNNPVRNEDGSESVNQLTHRKTRQLALQLMENRMAVGETTIVDATHIRMEDIRTYDELIKRYMYRVHVVKFGRDLTVEELIERDRKRGLGQVGEKAIRRHHARILNFDKDLPSRYGAMTPEEMIESLNWRIADANNYREIKVIGDVHASATALNTALEGFNLETLYVFIGDYFDRGVEPVKTMEKLMWLIDQPNVVLLQGNHERHAFNFVAGEQIKSRDFRSTLDEVLSAGYTKKHFAKLLRATQPVYAATFNGFNLVFTHAGLIPSQFGGSLEEYTKRLALRNEDEFIRGLGGYDYPVVDEWTKADLDCNQYYGHRNTLNYETIMDSNAFCLEQKVEFGGKLGVVVIRKEGVDAISTTDESIVNTVFNSEIIRERKKLQIKDLRDHPMVRTKQIGGGVSVLNFTRDAFFKKAWDAATVTARGLFVTEDNEVVARGYNKFFYMGERPETDIKTVAQLIKYSGTDIREQEKENGFLAIASYIPQLGGFHIFSKGAGELHSKIALDALTTELAINGITINDLSEYMRADYESGNKYSLTFEVCNSKLDPHIVHYEQPTVFLLDAIRNDLDGETIESVTDTISRKFHLTRPVVNTVPVDSMTVDEIEQHLHELEFRNLHNEGIVITFGDGQKLKVKSEWYNHRKQLRKLAQAVLNAAEVTPIIKKTRNKSPEWGPVLDELIKLKDAGQLVVVQNDRRLELNVPLTLIKPEAKRLAELLDEV